MERFFLLAAAMAVATLLGCGGDVVVDDGTGASTSTTSAGLTCEISPGAAGHVCINITGAPVTACPQGTQVSSCPSANVLGTCAISATSGIVTVNEILTFYSDGGLAVGQAQMACTSAGGTWTGA